MKSNVTTPSHWNKKWRKINVVISIFNKVHYCSVAKLELDMLCKFTISLLLYALLRHCSYFSIVLYRRKPKIYNVWASMYFVSCTVSCGVWSDIPTIFSLTRLKMNWKYYFYENSSSLLVGKNLTLIRITEILGQIFHFQPETSLQEYFLKPDVKLLLDKIKYSKAFRRNP